MRKTFIISAFPACGKTYAAKYLSERGVNVLDSDSSKFSWITDENGNKVRNPRFIEEYIAHIKENIGKVDLILVSSHETVRLALQENHIGYIFVCPDVNLKEQWIGSCFLRGNTPEFCRNLADHWEEWINKKVGSSEKREVLTNDWGDVYLLELLDTIAEGAFHDKHRQENAFVTWSVLNKLEDKDAYGCNISNDY